MDLIKMSCPSCGGSLQLPGDLDQVTCSYCNTLLVVQRGEGYASLKIAEKVEAAIRDSAADTRVAIEEGSQVTRDELRRLQLSQGLSAAQTRLASLQTEIRALEREKQKRKVKRQLKMLRKEERNLVRQVRSIEKSIGARLREAQAAQPPTARAPRKPILKSIRALLYGCGTWILASMICVILAGVLDDEILASAGEWGQFDALFCIGSLAAFSAGIFVIIYMLNPEARIWSNLRSLVGRSKPEKAEDDEELGDEVGRV